jgi:hypothetical protein
LCAYFKTYAMRQFNTESIMFWVEAEEFRRGEFVRPALEGARATRLGGY